MKKTLFQGGIILILFFGTWTAFTQIDWLKIFKVKQMSHKTEEKLGDLFWDIFKKSEVENKDSFVMNQVDSIVNRICKNNHIERNKIKLHILNNEVVNAFALPDGHLIVYSGLISACENPEELAGVICHEIAHIEEQHVMKKLVKEIGLSVLISISTGNAGGEIIKEATKTVTSTSFDRKLEKEADIKAVDYLVQANINPEHFANFLFKLSMEEPNAIKYLSWISTHPDSEERAEYIIQHSKNKNNTYTPILSPSSWQQLHKTLENTLQIR